MTGEPGSTPEAEAYRREVRAAKRRKGLVIVHTGEGKGKTTAAFGLALRARGQGLRVGVIQFIKHETANFGEIRAARDAGIHVEGAGDGWTWTSKDLDESAERARRGWERAERYMREGAFDLLVLDEFTYALHYGWVPVPQVLDVLRNERPPMMHVGITGRYAPAELIESADLVTEMRLVKHPFREQGIRAQRGIEF